MLATSFLYALFAGLTPSIIWLFFWLREDTHSEPRPILVITFLCGMLSVIIAMFSEKYVASIVSNTTYQYIIWAAIEEVLKFFVVVVVAVKTRVNKEPINAMIYCITAALGFAALENTLFIMNPLSSGAVAQGLITGNMRFMGATLVHVVSSASIGFALGYMFYHGKFVKTLAVIVGLAVAIAIHSTFNLSIVNANAIDTLRTFGWVWGGVVLLIVLFEEIKSVRPDYV